MKSTKIHPLNNLNEFWDWFRNNAGALATDAESPALLAELDRRIRNLDPRLSWEIGPGRSRSRQFVISPNLDRDLRTVTRRIVSHAPGLRDWEFHATRQPKEWDFKFELERTSDSKTIQLDASGWTFVLLQYPDGIREILLKGTRLPLLTEDEREQSAQIVLESVLGEDILIDVVDEFELVDELEPQFAKLERPIQLLREAVMGSRASAPIRKHQVN